MSIVMISTLLLLGIHEKELIGLPSWYYEQISRAHIITYAAIFLFLIFIVWFSNRENRRVLHRGRSPKKILDTERHNLEHDVTICAQEFVQIEEKYLQELERNSQFGKLSQGLIHDLMSPLSSISLYVEQLQTNTLNCRKLHRTIRKIVSVSRRMNMFMESLQHHMKNNTSVREEKTVNLVHEIRIARDILLFKSRMAQVQIVLSTPASLCIYANPVRIHQLIINLLSNAVESCDTTNSNMNKMGLVTVSVSQDREHIILSVTDTGCGISKERISHIFEKQFTTKLSGTGNGLHTIYSIVTEELDGKISICSELSKGTQFIITIPLIPNSIYPRKFYDNLIKI